jgi:hypothetical protein
MNKVQMVREINSLSSGTQAGLFNLTRYDEIEAAVALWVAWVEGHDDGRRWISWQDCWSEYKATL